MISFGLDEEQQLLQATVRSFARDEVRPALRAWERAGGVPEAARRRFFDLGLALLDVPEAVGGVGAGAVTAALVQEELAFGDPGAAVALWAPHLAAAAIVELGDAAQARRLLERFNEPGGAGRLGAVAWSERAPAPLAGFATVARPHAGGYRLHGHKAFVTNGGVADLTVVFAQLEGTTGWQGASAFVVESSGGRLPAGMAAGARHQLLGLETAHLAEVALDGVLVPEENRLRRGDAAGEPLRRFFARAALMTAARQVGLARASYEHALEYTQERQAFGKPVAHFQSIAFTLADMHMDVESARWMVWRAAAALDGRAPDLALVAEAAVHANEAAWRVADHGVQLLGGAGYIQDFPVEKWLRDTKALALLGGLDELHRLAVATAVLGHPLGDLLPSPALQPIVT